MQVSHASQNELQKFRPTASKILASLAEFVRALLKCSPEILDQASRRGKPRQVKAGILSEASLWAGGMAKRVILTFKPLAVGPGKTRTVIKNQQPGHAQVIKQKLEVWE